MCRSLDQPFYHVTLEPGLGGCVQGERILDARPSSLDVNELLRFQYPDGAHPLSSIQERVQKCIIYYVNYTCSTQRVSQVVHTRCNHRRRGVEPHSIWIEG